MIFFSNQPLPCGNSEKVRVLRLPSPTHPPKERSLYLSTRWAPTIVINGVTVFQKYKMSPKNGYLSLFNTNTWLISQTSNWFSWGGLRKSPPPLNPSTSVVRIVPTGLRIHPGTNLLLHVLAGTRCHQLHLSGTFGYKKSIGGVKRGISHKSHPFF